MRRPGVAALAALLISLAPGCRNGASGNADLSSYVSTSPPAGMEPLDIDFDGKARLVGFVVSPKQPEYPPGSKVTVTLVWRCDQKLDEGWLLFTHLLGPAGQTVLNLDAAGPLRHREGVAGQPLSPSRWEPGKLYRDELTFTVPASAPPSLTVLVGIYRAAARLPVKGAGADKQGRAVALRLATGAKDLAAEVKELAVVHLPAGATITVDGKLDESAWTGAAGTGPFVDVGSGRTNPGIPVQGEARLLWDDTALYVGFEVLEAKVRGGWPAGAKDPHLWEKDTVEIMADPDGDGDNKDYYELQVNPQNLVFDTQYDGYNAPNGNGRGPFGHEEWSANLESAIVVHGTIDDDSDTDRGYTVEAKIPWASFTKALKSPPAVGDAWRVNLYAMKNNGGVAWSPILGLGNFHRASRFGRVRWIAASPSR
ncbi:MAG: carbohydrate-binding family 9-like protein [Byssovorax sp.]